MNPFQRKKLNSLLSAGLAVFAMPGLAETSGPDIYGKVNVSFERQNTDGAQQAIQGKAATANNQWETNSNASRLGIKGSSDLDTGGLTFVYQAEYEINLDDGGNGDTAFSQRNVFAGVEGAFGQVLAGKIDSPLKSAEGKVDQFNDLRADIDNLLGGQNRTSNVLQYRSPKLANAVTITSSFIPGESSDTDLDGREDTGPADITSTSVAFDNQRFYLALAYDNNQVARRSIDGIARGNITRLVSTVKEGNFEAGVLWQRTEDVRPNSDLEDTAYLLSSAYRIGAFKLKGQYGLNEGEATGERGTLAALGVDYALGNKSTLYAYVSRLDLNDTSLTDTTSGLGFTHSF